MPAPVTTTVDRRTRQRLLRQARKMTEDMRATETRRGELAEERRLLLLHLNRECGVSYKRLAHETGLSPARLVQEIARAKEETGTTSRHPRYPAFGRDGE